MSEYFDTGKQCDFIYILTSFHHIKYYSEHGKLTELISINSGLKKKKLTRAGLEPTTCKGFFGVLFSVSMLWHHPL